MEWLLNLGYFGLFLGSFVAATVVPFSSDVQLASYWLGWLGKWEWIEKYMRVRHETLIKHKSKVDRYGAWLALLTWLPFIGDIFAIALGFYRVNFRKSALLMLIGKGARFVMWALLFLWGKAHIF